MLLLFSFGTELVALHPNMFPSQEYKNGNSDIENYLKLFFGLLFLHPDDVQVFFVDEFLPMKVTNQATTEFNDNILVKKVTDYVFHTYTNPNFKF